MSGGELIVDMEAEIEATNSTVHGDEVHSVEGAVVAAMTDTEAELVKTMNASSIWITLKAFST
eukprot:2657788-Amphidinium_carterae.1